MRDDPPHICAIPGCGQPVPRRPKDSYERWRVRKTCCSDHALMLSKLRNEENAADARARRRGKRCVVCTKPVPFHMDNRRQTCSDECAGRLIARARVKAAGRPRSKQSTVPPKVCAVCACEFHKRPGEKIGRFNERMTCGARDCATKLRADGCAATVRARMAQPREASKVAGLLAGLCGVARSRHAWDQATADERRLFAPELRRVFEAGA